MKKKREIAKKSVPDVKNGFPDIQGFSLRNLQYMRKFAEGATDANYAAAAAQIPWEHNMPLLDKTNLTMP